MNIPALSPAVILDRDGILHRDTGYLIRFEELEPIPGTEEALRLLQDKGFRLFVASNQSGVARGFFSLEDVLALNAKIQGFFLEKGVRIEDFAVCPHLPEGKIAAYAVTCDCRKPKPGMLLDLATRHGLDLSRSYMVGDSVRDVEAGVSAGATGVLIRPGPKGTAADKERLNEYPTLLDFAHSVVRV
jgi:D-glycero-D-manno-heptose 1,7-bisphosphate phosphatase